MRKCFEEKWLEIASDISQDFASFSLQRRLLKELDQDCIVFWIPKSPQRPHGFDSGTAQKRVRILQVCQQLSGLFGACPAAENGACHLPEKGIVFGEIIGDLCEDFFTECIVGFRAGQQSQRQTAGATTGFVKDAQKIGKRCVGSCQPWRWSDSCCAVVCRRIIP